MCLFAEKTVFKFTKGERHFVTLEKYGIVWTGKKSSHFKGLGGLVKMASLQICNSNFGSGNSGKIGNTRKPPENWEKPS